MNFSTEVPLPLIDDMDLFLEVHTHRDIRPPTAHNDIRLSDTERLADLGAKILDTVVTYHLFSKTPYISAQEIAALRQRYTSPGMLNTWLDSYNMKQRLRVPPERSDAIYNDPEEMASFFQTYVGAVYTTKKSLSPIQNWISKLIDPNLNPPVFANQQEQDGMGNGGNSYPSPPSQSSPIGFASPSYSTSSTSYSPAPPPGPPPPLPPSSHPLPPTLNLISLSLVNQTAMQKGFAINYAASQEGPPHQPTWTVRCLINNVERGRGTAKSQKLAKEEAARRAWLTMGW